MPTNDHWGKFEAGQDQMNQTKTRMKMEMHKKNTKDLKAIQMRLPQRSQIDSILNHQNRNGGNFFQSVDTRVRGAQYTHDNDTADSHDRLRASIQE